MNFLRSSKNHQPFFSQREGPLLLTTRLLIGQNHPAIPWPPSIGQAHGRWATPTLLGGVPSGGVCGSAHLLTSGRVLNGDRVESETGRVRCPLLADWLRRDAMPRLDSPTRALAGERAKNAASRVLLL